MTKSFLVKNPKQMSFVETLKEVFKEPLLLGILYKPSL